MLHRVRLAMQTGTFEKLKGECEADETFIGGKAKFMHSAKRSERIQGRGTVGKTIVQGLLERGGEVRVSVVADQKKGTLQENVRRHRFLAVTGQIAGRRLTYKGLIDKMETGLA